jgi:acyl-coenzyme A thioesterase PaaI-like protein
LAAASIGALFGDASDSSSVRDNQCEDKSPREWKRQRSRPTFISRSHNIDHINCSSSMYNSRILSSRLAYCEESTHHEERNKDNQELPLDGMDYFYMKMNPEEMFHASMLDSHAVFGPLHGPGLIERFDVYKHVSNNHSNDTQQGKNERVVVAIKLGTRLNGHGGVVHGGIISLLLDSSMGFAYVGLLKDSKEIAVTANLEIDFRAPLNEGSEAVIRVYLDKIEGRKIFFSAVLENKDGSVVYAHARSLFLKIDKSKVDNEER